MNRIKIYALLLLPFAAQLMLHSRNGDDWPNSQRYNWILFRYGTVNLESFLNEIQFNINSWIQGQGRFFPVNVLTEGLFFTFFRTDFSRNFAHLIVYMFCLTIWTALIGKLFSNTFTSIFFVFAVVTLTRFRWDFDPHVGFGNLLPLTLFFLGASIYCTLLGIEKERNSLMKVFLLVSGGVLFLISLMTYEIGIYLLPAILYLSVVYRPTEIYSIKGIVRRVSMVSPLVISTSFYLYLVFLVFRPKANASGAYVTGFDFHESFRVFLINLVAPLPLINYKMSEFFKLPNLTIFQYVAFIGVLSIIIVSRILSNAVESTQPIEISSKKGSSTKRNHKKVSIYLLSISMISSPAFMISIQPAWWPRMKWGNSYLGVFMQEIGFALLLTTFLYSNIYKSAIKDKLREKTKKKS